MNIHEYQAKAVLKQYGVPVSRGVPIMAASEAEAAAKELGGPLWVVKSQIHAGGRGKGRFTEARAGDKGGVRLARSIEEVKTFADEMLGSTLVTIQTGPAGKQVSLLNGRSRRERLGNLGAEDSPLLLRLGLCGGRVFHDIQVYQTK